LPFECPRGSRTLFLLFPVDLHFPSINCQIDRPLQLQEFRVVMTPDDLKKAGLDEIGKKWA
jgi:hypothetical protein